ncbi:MAG: D-TA family PLP-dependent enzyme [Chloroflexi bacterium]|nr:D-TA family PLP-dependent enzyme [Chloroflexota bacterium]
MHVYDLETPSVLIDLDRLENNITRMQAHCDSLGIKLRPHIKTHKIPAIAQMQIDAGAVGIACQKLSEAAIFAEAGFNDIVIPYNIVGPQKTARLADLALFNRIAVSADHPAVLQGLAEAVKVNELTLQVLVELGTEIERTGASIDRAVDLAQRIEREEHLNFAGVLLYPSTPVMRPPLQELLARLDTDGIGVSHISGGGTGAAQQAANFPELTELRVGTYVFNDWRTVSAGWATLDDCAMFVTATVVSHPHDKRMILDSGSKTLTAEAIAGEHGYILEYPEARIYQLNEEHAYVDLSDCDARPEIGDRVHIVPVHTCVVTNMHNTIYGVRGDQVEVEWPVAARGRVW